MVHCRLLKYRVEKQYKYLPGAFEDARKHLFDMLKWNCWKNRHVKISLIKKIWPILAVDRFNVSIDLNNNNYELKIRYSLTVSFFHFPLLSFFLSLSCSVIFRQNFVILLYFHLLTEITVKDPKEYHLFHFVVFIVNCIIIIIIKALIPLSLSRHPSRSATALGKSLGRHLVWM